MRIFALELNNDIKGIEERKEYIESIIARLDNPDFIVLPELAICSYMASQEIWKFADEESKGTSEWAITMAKKYQSYIGVGYIDKEDGDYFNRYLIAGPDDIYGKVTKSEGESAVFKRGYFDNIIKTPLGNIAIAICYDARRKHFYNNIKDKEISLILFPHGSPANPRKPDVEIKGNNYLCNTYLNAFNVPVIYVNSFGKLEDMPGRMGSMMKKAGFQMNGKTKIYTSNNEIIESNIPESFGADIKITPQKLKKPIRFYGNNLIKGNFIFRTFILKPDIKAGKRLYKINQIKN